jgi:hypothetical protein
MQERFFRALLCNNRSPATLNNLLEFARRLWRSSGDAPNGFLALKSRNLERMTAMPQSTQDEPKIKMRPELELVLLSARTKSPQNEYRIRGLFSEGVNWTEVVACASQHNLLPVLCKHFLATEADLLGQDQRGTLIEIERLLGRNSLLLLGQMLRLHGLFESAEVPAIPFKGPVLAWLAFQSFTLRTYEDLDFVVPQRYIPQVLSVLLAAGYNPKFDSPEAQAGMSGPAPGQYAFVSESNGTVVELHTERTLRYFPRGLDLDEMNARLIPLEIGGRKLRTFSVEDTLVMLCVHGAKHFWERLAWTLDVAQLVTVQEVDWRLLLEIAAKMESTRVLLLGLYLAQDLFNASLPQSVMQDACGDPQVQWLAKKVREQYLGVSSPSTGVCPRGLFRLRSRDKFWPGLRHVLRLGMNPTESDRETVRLPGLLSPLYMLVRPWRLLREYGLGLKRRLKPDLAIYEPTPPEIIEEMLRLAGASEEDVLYDLGCGDGRIVVAAAEKYGIRAVGVDINPKRIAEARANARQHGVEKRVQFILGDAKGADFREATVITMYLGADGNLRLADRLREHLRSGARIVSRDFLIYGWAPERVENRVMSNGIPTSLYLWTIKKSEGEFQGTIGAPPGTAATRWD